MKKTNTPKCRECKQPEVNKYMTFINELLRFPIIHNAQQLKTIKKKKNETEMIFKRQPLNCQHLTWDYYKEDVAGFNTYVRVKPSPMHIVL